MAEGKTFWNVVSENKALQATLVIIGVAAVSIPVVLILKKNLSGVFSKSDSEKTVNDLAKEVNRNRLTYTEGQYKAWAGMLYQAMNGAGTNTDTVNRVIGYMKNPDDWKFLQVSFGVRKSTQYFTDYSGTLTEWLEDELSSSEFNKIVDILRKIGVTI